MRHTLVNMDSPRGTPQDDVTQEMVDGYVQEVSDSKDEMTLKEIYDACVESEIIDLVASDGETLRTHVMNRLNIFRGTSDSEDGIS